MTLRLFYGALNALWNLLLKHGTKTILACNLKNYVHLNFQDCKYAKHLSLFHVIRRKNYFLIKSKIYLIFLTKTENEINCINEPEKHI